MLINPFKWQWNNIYSYTYKKYIYIYILKKKITIHYSSYVWQAIALSRLFSHSAKYTSQSKEKTDDASTDKTEQDFRNSIKFKL